MAKDFKGNALQLFKKNLPKVFTVNLLMCLVQGNLGTKIYIQNDRLMVNNAQVQDIIGLAPEVVELLLSFATIYLIWEMLSLVFGAGCELGLVSFQRELLKTGIADESVFKENISIGRGIELTIYRFFKTFFWFLLLIIPGIVKIYGYFLAPYIMMEDNERSASSALEESERIMLGHKEDLFYFRLSFIGWELLAALPQALITYLILQNLNSVGTIITLTIISIILSIPEVMVISWENLATADFCYDLIKNNKNE